MGGKGSKPEPVYPPPDSIFLDLGCIGLTRQDYSGDNGRLASAPFFSIRIDATSYEDMLSKIILTLQNSHNDPESDALITGPVYMLAAYDLEKRAIECYLYFPSMSKKQQKCASYYELGIYHRWMYRLLNNSMYKRIPHSSCKVHVPVGVTNVKKGDPSSFIYGCRTDKSSRCMQSESVHKGMGIFDSKKKPPEYPDVYFRMYRINHLDERVSSRFAAGTLTRLARNILPSGMDLSAGCNSMLVSNNSMFAFMLTSRKFGIYRLPNGVQCKTSTWTKLFEQRIKGYYNTKMVIEDSFLNAYSSLTQNGTETNIYSLRIARDDTRSALALVLGDDGSLSVFDKNNVSVQIVNADGTLDTSVTNDEGTHAETVNGNWKEYDEIEDFRRRMLNLRAYLRAINYLVEETTGVDPSTSQLPIPRTILDSIPAFDAEIDYHDRYNEWLEYLHIYGHMDIELVKQKYIPDGPDVAAEVAAQELAPDTYDDNIAGGDDDPDITPAEREAAINKKQEADAKKKKDLEDLQRSYESAITSGDVDPSTVVLPPPVGTPVRLQASRQFIAPSDSAINELDGAGASRDARPATDTGLGSGETSSGFDNIADFRRRLEILRAMIHNI